MIDNAEPLCPCGELALVQVQSSGALLCYECTMQNIVERIKAPDDLEWEYMQLEDGCFMIPELHLADWLQETT